MYEVTDEMPQHARVVLIEPEAGRSRAFFDREMAQYAEDRGAAPRTATLHPDTMTALGFRGLWALGPNVMTPRGPMLVSSVDYARDRITLFEQACHAAVLGIRKERALAARATARAEVELFLWRVDKRDALFQDMRIRVCIAVGDPHAEWNLSPGKKMLQCISQGDITQRRISEAPAAFCGACALRTKCTTSKRG